MTFYSPSIVKYVEDQVCVTGYGQSTAKYTESQVCDRIRAKYSEIHRMPGMWQDTGKVLRNTQKTRYVWQDTGKVQWNTQKTRYVWQDTRQVQWNTQTRYMCQGASQVQRNTQKTRYVWQDTHQVPSTVKYTGTRYMIARKTGVWYTERHLCGKQNGWVMMIEIYPFHNNKGLKWWNFYQKLCFF